MCNECCTSSWNAITVVEGRARRFKLTNVHFDILNHRMTFWVCRRYYWIAEWRFEFADVTLESQNDVMSCRRYSWITEWRFEFADVTFESQNDVLSLPTLLLNHRMTFWVCRPYSWITEWRSGFTDVRFESSTYIWYFPKCTKYLSLKSKMELIKSPVSWIFRQCCTISHRFIICVW